MNDCIVDVEAAFREGDGYSLRVRILTDHLRNWASYLGHGGHLQVGFTPVTLLRFGEETGKDWAEVWALNKGLVFYVGGRATKALLAHQLAARLL